jgi:hypothetical protein
MHHNASRTLKLLLILTLLSFESKAQPYLDLGQANFWYAPPAGNVQHFTQYRIQANLPLVMKKSKDILLLNPIWEGRKIGFKDEPGNDYKLNGLIVWLTYTRQLGKGRSLMLAAIPRWNGEPSIQFSQGFQMGGAGLYTWRQSPKLEFKLGLYYNREFFGNFFMPLGGMDWTINKKDRIFGVMPGYFTYEHRINPKLSWGGAFRTFTNSYKLNARIAIDPPPLPDYIRVDDNQLGIYTDLYVAPKWVFNLEGGLSILRKVRQGRAYEHPDITRGESTNLYFRASFQYRLRFD